MNMNMYWIYDDSILSFLIRCIFTIISISHKRYANIRIPDIIYDIHIVKLK